MPRTMRVEYADAICRVMNRGDRREDMKDFPDTKVLILSAHSDEAYVEQVSMLGAAGFLLKQTSAHVLATAIREVHKGNTFSPPATSKRVHDCGRSRGNGAGNGKRNTNCLSSREVEVLQLIAEGKPNKQVAAELSVSFKTVDKHRQHLMAKLNIHDIAGLTRYAINTGVIESRVQVTIL